MTGRRGRIKRGGGALAPARDDALVDDEAVLANYALIADGAVAVQGGTIRVEDAILPDQAIVVDVAIGLRSAGVTSVSARGRSGGCAPGSDGASRCWREVLAVSISIRK
jgi:hypothetical protein